MLKQYFKIACAASFLSMSLWLPKTQAEIVLETWFHRGVADSELVQYWNQLLKTKSIPRQYRIHLDHPASWELEPLIKLKAQALHINIQKYPSPEAMKTWKTLQEMGAQLTLFGTGAPTDLELARINSLKFPKLTLVLFEIPSIEEVAQINRLESELSITLTGRYPTILHRDAFRLFPKNLKLLFATDYWPWYSHMDLMNMIPQNIHIRVEGSFPSVKALEYLHNIHRLKTISITTSSEVSPDNWSGFKKIPLQWTSRNWVPSVQSLEGFVREAGTDQRRMTLDHDEELTIPEYKRIQSLSIPVHRIRKAPIADSLK